MTSLNRVPLATYRLQFNSDFTFQQAHDIIEYLKALGITDLYASPLFDAGPESTHGYDICSFEKLNPALGNTQDFIQLTSQLQERGMGLLLDMVPNHMGAYQCNPWWNDVLKFGQESRFANYFDINWELGKGKVLLPVLGKLYHKALEAGELNLRFEDNEWFIAYFDKRFPVTPTSLAPGGEITEAEFRSILEKHKGTPGQIETWDKLHELIQKQNYRLAYWRVAREEINYRRFFDVTGLVSLRIENPEVFEASHRALFEMLSAGQITGLRIDHPDGLLDPKQYFERLQQKQGGKGERLYVVVEKILSDEEKLPRDWPVEGTTGYDFLNYLNGLFVRKVNERRSDEIYEMFTSEKSNFDNLVRQCKAEVLERSLTSELNQLSRRLKHLAEATREGVDFTFTDLRKAVVEFIAAFPVYRTYISEQSTGVSDSDKNHILQAVEACKMSPCIEAIRFLSKILLLEELHDSSEEVRKLSRQFVLKFQQVSGPATAKGLEDTAFYKFHRLVSLNEVGGNPGRFGYSDKEFHDYNLYKLKTWPNSLSATATHDTKRGEDVRARLNVLSEIPEEWESAVTKWKALNSSFKTKIEGNSAPSSNDEYLFYQTLVGSWNPGEKSEAYIGRVQRYMVKALREAKKETSWVNSNEPYENACQSFVEKVIRSKEFLREFIPIATRLAEFGRYNSLAQTVIKICSPGVPDFYQGSEFWDLNLVDPDNRRPVDYVSRKEALERVTNITSPGAAKELLDSADPGIAKLFTIFRALKCRAENKAVFQSGSYAPMKANGTRMENVIAFSRELEGRRIVAAVPRFLASSTWSEKVVSVDFWKKTNLQMEGNFRNIFTSENVNSHRSLNCAELFQYFPVAILEALP
jgi:(1->4)-alpha-D-glucan 1-alpha-D-glucosylmutase